MLDQIRLRYQNHLHDLAPSQKHVGDVGLDIPAPFAYLIPAGQYVAIKTGLVVEHIPDGFYLELVPKSASLGSGMYVQTGTIDTCYRGEIAIGIFAFRQVNITQGHGIAQLVVRRAWYPENHILINNQPVTPLVLGDRGKDGGIWRIGAEGGI